jgi:hypothetical protein
MDIAVPLTQNLNQNWERENYKIWKFGLALQHICIAYIIIPTYAHVHKLVL